MAGASAVAVLVCVIAGLGGGIQAAIMGRFGERVGVVEAVAFSSLVTTLLSLSVLLLVRQSLAGIGESVRAPAWLWLGGVMGVFIVFTITVAAPRIGTAATIGLLIAGQLAMGVAIDRFGLFGVDQIGVSWPRLLGIALLAAGAALSLHKA
jgi:transporter family-2 protein